MRKSGGMLVSILSCIIIGCLVISTAFAESEDVKEPLVIVTQCGQKVAFHKDKSMYEGTDENLFDMVIHGYNVEKRIRKSYSDGSGIAFIKHLTTNVDDVTADIIVVENGIGTIGVVAVWRKGNAPFNSSYGRSKGIPYCGYGNLDKDSIEMTDHGKKIRMKCKGEEKEHFFDWTFLIK